jgi:hypothetical protein
LEQLELKEDKVRWDLLVSEEHKVLEVLRVL